MELYGFVWNVPICIDFYAFVYVYWNLTAVDLQWSAWIYMDSYCFYVDLCGYVWVSMG